jgi:flagellar biosynthesis protein FlhG
MPVEGKKARRFAIISGKGGVGKTLITVNVAAALASAGSKTLVIDADLGLANLDVLLGITPRFTFHDVLSGKRSVEETLLHTKQGFDLLPAASGLPECTVLTQTLAEKVEPMLSNLESRYDTILFDAGAGIGEVVLFFANLAHEILIVVTPEATSMMDAYATMKVLRKIYGKTEFLLVVNQTNPSCPGPVGISVANHLKNVTDKFLTTDKNSPIHIQLIGSIPLDPIVPQAINRRQLLVDIQPQAPSTNLMNRLAESILARI